jgi:hypothetical protein
MKKCFQRFEKKNDSDSFSDIALVSSSSEEEQHYSGEIHSLTKIRAAPCTHSGVTKRERERQRESAREKERGREIAPVF